MTCSELEEIIKRFLKRVHLHSPFKVNQSIIIQLAECMIEVIKQENAIQVKETSSSTGKLIIKLENKGAFLSLFGSKNMEEYGNLLVKLSTQGQIFMDAGPYEDPMKNGFHRFIGYIKKQKGFVTYRWIIPTFK